MLTVSFLSDKGVRDFHRAAIFVIQPNAVADILRELHNRIGAYPAEVAVVSSLLVGHLDPIV